MYPFSAAFLEALHKAQHVEHVRGTVGGVPFTDNNILGMSYVNRCSDPKDVTLGSAFIGKLQVQFQNIAIPRGQWKGKKIVLEWGLELENQTVEYIPAGVFYIASAPWSVTGVTVTAYDIMSFLEEDITFSQSSGTIYGYLSLMASELDVEMGITAEECAALPNGTQLLGIYPGASLTKWRDLASYLGHAVGGFVCATRDGKLTIKSFADSQIVDELTEYEREVHAQFSDFDNQYMGISMVDMEDNTQIYIDGQNGSGSSYINIGSNPLLQYGIPAVKAQIRGAVADVAAGINYTPFNAPTMSGLAYDLGDLITNSGGIAGETDLTCCVMSVEWSFKQLTNLIGYGSDPALSGGMTRADRAVSSLAKNQKSDGLTYYTFVNTEAVNLTTTAKELYSIAFAVTETTTVTLWNEIKSLNTLSGDTQSITYEYYLDGVKFDYEPVDTFGEDGYHTEPHPFWLQNVEAGRIHTWLVKAKIDGGTASVAIGDIHALIMGQKMAAQAGFDGNLELYDEITPIILHRAFASLTENVSLDTQRPTRISVSDDVPVLQRRSRLVALYDSALLVGEPVRYRRITEDGDTRITEDGSVRMTE